MQNNEPKDKDLKRRLFLWLGKAKTWIVHHPIVSGGVLTGSIVVILLIAQLSPGPSSSLSLSSTPTSISTSTTSTTSTSTSTTATSTLTSTPSPSPSSTPSSAAPLTEVTVTFDTQGGNALASITGLPGANITANLITTKFANTFVKFSSDAGGTDTLNLSVFPNTSLTAYAIWNPDLFNVDFFELSSPMKDFATHSAATLYVNQRGELFGLGRNSSGIFGNGLISSTILTVPVRLTSHLPLNQDEAIDKVKVYTTPGFGIAAMLLTTQRRLLIAGNNYNLMDGSQGDVNITTYKDITSTLGLINDETIVDIILVSQVQGVRTSNNRFIFWGQNDPIRLFPQPGNIASHLAVGTPTDVTSFLTQSLVGNETIDLLSVIGDAGVFKTSNNRYFVWGKNNAHALMMFQAQNFNSSVPVEVTSSVLNVIGQNNQIVSFVPIHSGLVMNFFTSDNQLYNYGDYRFLFLPNTSDRPTYDANSFFGDSTPLNISAKFELLEGEYPTYVFGSGFLTNLNRYRRGSSYTGAYVLSTGDLNPLLMEGEIIVAAFGTIDNPWFTTNFGRIFNASNSLTVNNRTGAILETTKLSSLDLPYHSDITYTPVRDGFVFRGWFTDKNLNSPFTGKVPANNNLILYGQFSPVAME